jgi:hypothetical protein
MRGVWMNGFLAKESTIEKTNHSENLPYPLFAKEGEFLPFVKLARTCLPAGRSSREGEEGFDLQ